MIYRIDMQRYLTHAIDYFTLKELLHFQYCILSASVKNGGRMANIAKISSLYPPPDVISTYMQYQDISIFEKMYIDFLEPDMEDIRRMEQNGSYFINNMIYKTFINPLKNHHDILIICDEKENYIIDVLSKYLKEKFHIEVIDLNQLFRTGRIGPIYIDRKEIFNNSKKIEKMAIKDAFNSMESTAEGRRNLILNMTKKQKIQKLKDLGIDPVKDDLKNLDKLLIEAWDDYFSEKEF